MQKDRNPIRRRTALKLVGGGIVASTVSAGLAGASQHCDQTVSDGDSIQAAIDSATTGDTICVEVGTFAEDVTVDVEDVTLSGPNAGTRGSGDRDDEATIEGQVVLSADGTTLDGFDVSPPPAQSNPEGEAVRISNTPDDVSVVNNIVRDFEEDGVPAWEGIEGIVAFGGDENDPITDVTVSRNKVQNIEGRDEKGGAAGIMVQGHVDGAVVDHNDVSDVGRETTTWAHGVVVTGTGNHGKVPEDVEIADNDISSILPDPSSGLDGVGVGIEANGIEYRITGNQLEDNTLGVEVKAAAGETDIDHNDIEGNDNWGVSNRDDETLDATDNWWGHASGPGGPDGRRNPAGKEVGKGDDINGDVEFDPWLRRPIDSPSR